MFADARRIPDGGSVAADVCIVGGGPAGIAIARELSGTRLRVAVLESGGLEPGGSAQELNDGEVTGLPYFPLASARLRGFGGTSGHWDGLTRPFEAIDFERREGVRYSGWPIAHADVRRHEGRAAAFCGLEVARWDPPYWRARDASAPPELPGGRVLDRVAQQVPEGARRFGRSHREELRRASNVTVHLHATVTEIEADADVRTVTGLRVATPAGTRFRVVARHVVLAAGGLENARLLLASARRRPRGLGNDHDVVGRFFLEHPRYLAGTLLPADPLRPTSFYTPHAVAGATILGYLGLSDAVKRAEGLLDVQLRLTPRFEDAYEQAAVSADVAAANALRDGRVSARQVARVLEDVLSWHALSVPGAPVPLPRPEVASKLAGARPGELRSLAPELLGDIAATALRNADRAPVERIGLSARFEPTPNPDSRVRLGRERDAFGMRRVELDWRLSEDDRRSVRRTLEILGASVGRAGLGRIRIEPEPGDGTWPADLAGGWHHMGTTRMADDPREGVVDRHCRVHGVANLHVAGSSVFPTAGSGTPTLTLVALALRLADRLKAVAT